MGFYNNQLGGYRIIDLGERTFQNEVPVTIPGIWDYVKTFDQSVPVVLILNGQPWAAGCSIVTEAEVDIDVPGLGGYMIESSDSVVQMCTYDIGRYNKVTKAAKNYIDPIVIIPTIPTPTTADNGKILKIANGKYTLATP